MGELAVAMDHYIDIGEGDTVVVASTAMFGTPKDVLAWFGALIWAPLVVIVTPHDLPWPLASLGYATAFAPIVVMAFLGRGERGIRLGLRDRFELRLDRAGIEIHRLHAPDEWQPWETIDRLVLDADGWAYAIRTRDGRSLELSPLLNNPRVIGRPIQGPLPEVLLRFDRVGHWATDRADA